MSASLNNARAWWRPVLGAGTAANCIAYPWAALVVAWFKPDVAPTVLAMMTALFGFGAGLWGFREWGKSKGVEG